MITTVDMNQIRPVKPLISEVLFERMQETLARGEKILLSLNRRGAMSTFVCRDCGWAARCPSCDLLMRVHLRPENCLLCHFCEAKATIPDRCPKCSSYHLVQSGARVQAIDASVRELLPEARILLIEDLNKITPKILAEHDIFIGTQKISSLPIENLGLTAFLLVESDLAVPDYDIEESMYHQIRHFFSRSRDIILQTRSPKLPLITDVTSGNFRSFFQRTISERKQFHLPPFTQMVTIHISDTTENLVKQRIASTASSMIEAAKMAEDTTVIYDHLLVEKRAGKYRQKILIRSPKMLAFLEPFRAQIIRGRGIEVEWL